MGLFDAIGGLLGLNSNKKAIQNAANQANAGLQNGINSIAGQQNNNNALFAPTEQAGNQATTSLAQLLGLGTPGGVGAGLDSIRGSDLFKSLNDIGTNTVLQNASATGGLRSGNTDTALYNEGTGLANGLYQQQVGNLAGLSGLGLTASNANAGVNSGLSGSIAQMLGLQGENQGNATLGKTQASNQAFKGLTDFLNAAPSSGGSNGSNIFNMIASLF